jgi:hypothetical protein
MSRGLFLPRLGETCKIKFVLGQGIGRVGFGFRGWKEGNGKGKVGNTNELSCAFFPQCDGWRG